MTDTVKGTCHCGQVTIEVSTESIFDFSCHCAGCRKLSSGGRLLSHGTALDSVTVTGETKTYTYAGGSGKDVVLTFCPNCSTQIYGEPKAHPGMAAIRASLLDNAATFTPMQFIHTDDAYPWDKTDI